MPAAEPTYTNPLAFSYPYSDGTRERTITELRDPAIIREGNLYYLTFTVFPFTHSDSRKADKPDDNSPPGIMLYCYFGMRSLGKQTDPQGFTRFLPNGQPTLMAGALDQGFWPDGLHYVELSVRGLLSLAGSSASSALLG